MGSSQDDALVDAVFAGDLKAVEAALRAGADVNAKRDGRPNALYFAAAEGNAKIVRRLLEAGGQVNAVGQYGAPLHGAARLGALPVIELLLEAGANVNLAGGSMKNTPVHEAIYAKKPKALALLLDSGADLDIVNDNGFDALGAADAFFERAVPLVKAAAKGKPGAKRRAEAKPPAAPALAKGKDARLFEAVVEGLVRYAEGHHRWFEKNVGPPHRLDVSWDVPSRETYAPIEELGITIGCEVEDEDRAEKKLRKAGFEGSGGEFYRAFGSDALDLKLPSEKQLCKLVEKQPAFAGFLKNGDGQIAGKDYSIYRAGGDKPSELELWLEHVVASAVMRAGEELRQRLADCEINIGGHDGCGPRTFRAHQDLAAELRKKHRYVPTPATLSKVLGALIGTPAVRDEAVALAALGK